MRKPCCDKQDTNKGAWSKQEDEKLINYIRIHGEGCWRTLPQAAGFFSYMHHHFKKKKKMSRDANCVLLLLLSYKNWIRAPSMR